MTDLSTGVYAYGAIMAALLDRHKTGRGQRVQCNLLSTQVATEILLCHTCTTCSLLLATHYLLQVAILSHIACNYLNAGMEGERWGAAHPTIAPYQVIMHTECTHVACWGLLI